jgi:hypothetical protein
MDCCRAFFSQGRLLDATNSTSSISAAFFFAIRPSFTLYIFLAAPVSNRS